MIDLRLGDCLELIRSLPDASVDCVITDPPYPDQYEELYNYQSGQIDFLQKIDCRQLIFWSARFPFPLDYTAIHIWDKKMGAGRAEYDRIFERNGQNGYLMFREYFINSTVAASFGHDIFTAHPSQKPIQLLKKMIERFTKQGDTVLDPFMGSGTTGVACVKLNRSFIGMEISPEYFSIAEKRIAEAQRQMLLPLAQAAE